MKKKLRSNSGMSILLALLILLVCAVAASVILSAATTAAGRMRGTAEMDRRYYSVTSAAELLRRTLCDGDVTIEQTRISVTVDSVTTLADGTEQRTSETEVTYAARMDGADLSPDREETLKQKLARRLIFGNIRDGAEAAESAWNRTPGEELRDQVFAMTLCVGEPTDMELAHLFVEARATLEADGTLALRITDEEGYTVQMVFAAVIRENFAEETAEDEPVIQWDEESGAVTETVTVTESATEVTDIKWTYISTERVSSYDGP